MTTFNISTISKMLAVKMGKAFRHYKRSDASQFSAIEDCIIAPLATFVASTKLKKKICISSLVSPNICEVSATYDNKTKTMHISVHNPTNDFIQINAGDIIAQDMKGGKIAISTISSNGLKLVEQQLRADPHLTNKEIDKQLLRYAKKGSCVTSATHAINNSNKLQILNSFKKLKKSPKQIFRDLTFPNLKDIEHKKCLDIMRKYISVFRTNNMDFQHTDLLEAEIELTSQNPILNAKYTAISENVQKKATEIIEDYMRHGLLMLTDEECPFVSNILFQRNEDKEIVAILDNRVLNFNAVKKPTPAMNHQKVMKYMANKQHVSSFKLFQPNLSIPLSAESRKYSSFYDSRKRHLCFTSVPRGYINKDYYVDQLLQKTYVDMKGVFWIDETVYITTDGNIAKHLHEIEKVFKRTLKANLKIMHETLYINQSHINLMGVIYNRDKLSIPKAKIQGFQDLPVPNTAKQLQTMLAAASKYTKFIKDYAMIAEPLTRAAATCTQKALEWDEELQKAFKNWKKSIRDTVDLNIPNPNKEFICHSDACNMGISFCIEQEDENGDIIPIAFLSRVLTEEERKYSTFQQEALALLYGLTAFDIYLSGAARIRMITDAKGLVFLRSCKGNNPKLAQIASTLSAYQMQVEHLAGIDNVTADCLSRMHKDADRIIEEAHKKSTSMNEHEAILILNKMTIQEGQKFTIKQVKNLLDGDAFPSFVQRKRVKASKPHSFFDNKRALPTIKARRNAKMPATKKYHRMYETQHEDLRRERNKKREKDLQHPSSEDEEVEERTRRKRPQNKRKKLSINSVIATVELNKCEKKEHAKLKMENFDTEVETDDEGMTEYIHTIIPPIFWPQAEANSRGTSIASGSSEFGE